jgi:hypothetical protein
MIDERMLAMRPEACPDLAAGISVLWSEWIGPTDPPEAFAGQTGSSTAMSQPRLQAQPTCGFLHASVPALIERQCLLSVAAANERDREQRIAETAVDNALSRNAPHGKGSSN